MEPVRFRVALGALVGLYLLIELVYVGRLPLAMDEFQFASEIERLRSAVPYRDFPPYKNLLGFYLQSVPLAVGRWLGLGPWNDLILLKASMAIAVALTIFWIADRLRAFFDERSILQATALLVVMSTFLERSGVIRVEMLASLLGLGGALFLLRGRAMASGLLVGLAFLVTQKAIYFVLAVGAAFAFECLARRGREGSGRALLTFALSVLAPVVLYFGAFTLVAGVDRVWQAMFVDSSQVALWTDYSDKRLEFWQQTISRNPVFYLLGVAGIGCLLAPPLAARRPVDDRRRFAVHSLVLLALCLWHRQPWPYFFVMLIPTLWITSITSFEALSRWRPSGSPRLARAVVALVILLGMGIPLSRVPTVLARDNGYQRSNFEVLDRLVGPGETYLAGTDILYHRPPQPRPVRWLDRRRMAEIEAQSPEERRAFMLELHAAPIKAVVANFRTDELPEELHRYLGIRFRPMFGSISTAAPQCDRETSRVAIRFAGEYLLHVSPGTSRVEIDGQSVAPGTRILLSSGVHRAELDGYCQLQVVLADLPNIADARFAERRPFFEDVYDY